MKRLLFLILFIPATLIIAFIGLMQYDCIDIDKIKNAFDKYEKTLTKIFEE